MSLDALRGFDMFWIVGADSLVQALAAMRANPVTSFFATQLDHVEWDGFRFYDLIFPLFVFMVGASLVFSLSRTLEQHGRTEALKRIVRRSVLLFLIALIYSGGFAREWPDIRLLGVLNRIALAYFFASIAFCYLRTRGLIALCASLLIVYWALMTFVPIRDIQLEKSNLARLAEQTGTTNAMTLFLNTTNRVTGHFEKGFNLANHLDFQYLPGKKWDTYWDPEGLLSTLPAIATCLLGVFAGLLLRSPTIAARKKVIYLFAAGALSVVAGFLWGLQFPVIKKIWTSSYVLVAGGYSAMLVGLFYLIVDVWKYRRWCQPFVWVGMNSITIYMANNIIGFERLAQRFVGGNFKNFLDTHIMQGLGELAIACVALGIGFALVYFLYRKKIFLRL
jgi:predicted acyltransferase